MEKKQFVESKLELIEIVAEDIISTSPDTELPDLPFSLRSGNDPFNS